MLFYIKKKKNTLRWEQIKLLPEKPFSSVRCLVSKDLAKLVKKVVVELALWILVPSLLLVFTALAYWFLPTDLLTHHEIKSTEDSGGKNML